jgi:hypothetical protein
MLESGKKQCSIWIWRFKAHPEALWVSIINAIHGSCGNLDRDITLGKYSTWLDCIRNISQLKGRGVDLFMCMNKKVRNGNERGGSDNI